MCIWHLSLLLELCSTLYISKCSVHNLWSEFHWCSCCYRILKKIKGHFKSDGIHDKCAIKEKGKILEDWQSNSWHKIDLTTILRWRTQSWTALQNHICQTVTRHIFNTLCSQIIYHPKSSLKFLNEKLPWTILSI